MACTSVILIPLSNNFEQGSRDTCKDADERNHFPIIPLFPRFVPWKLVLFTRFSVTFVCIENVDRMDDR